MARSRWLGLPLFLLAALVLLAGAVALRDTRGYAVRVAEDTYIGDISDGYVFWTRLVTLGGVQDAYRGTWPETYAVYPPVTLYPYQVVGNAYRALVDPTFDLQAARHSLWLARAIKAVAVLWHLLTGVAIFLLVRRANGPRLAGVAGALYLASPAALFDAAHWAQPDGAHSLFGVLAVGWIGAGATLLGWGAMALAALAKPQAWAVLPLLLLASWRVGGPRRLLLGGAVGAGVAVVVLLPFLLTGRLGEFLGLPGTISTVMPVVSANAHNAWHLLFWLGGDDPLTTLDTDRLLGPLTFRAVAGALVLAQFVFTYWLYWTRRVDLPEAAAMGALGWFVFTTQAHENHLFFALPLLSLAWPSRPTLLVPFGVLSLTVLLNMALHDQLFLEALGFGLGDPLVLNLRLLGAAANVACFFGWGAAAAARAPRARVGALGDRAATVPPASPPRTAPA